MKRELLRMESVSFGEHGQMTLDNLSMTLYEGEILGVLSNHAGVKKDLVELVSGRKGGQSGRLYLGTEPCPFEDVDRRKFRMVGVIHSVKTLVDDLSISENIFVIRKGVKSQIINKRLLHTQASQLMQEFGLSLEPRTLVRNLSGVERCILEIVKVIALGARIVILQNLSSFLSDFEIEKLLRHAAHLKSKGVGFLMVDSSVSYLAKYADRVVVIKNGRSFWTFGRGELNETVLRSCYSRDQLIDFPDANIDSLELFSEKPEVLIFDRVQSGALDSLSFSLHPGEILCIVDREGDGIEEIKALLSGEHQVEAGHILTDGVPFTAHNVWQALDQKIAFIVENPADTMLFPDFTAIENLCYPSSRKTPYFWINPNYLSSCLHEYSPFFDSGVLDQYPGNMSTQDLHKLVYCRWHLYNPSLVVCVKPFSSVDKNLEEISVYFIGLLLKKGIAVLVLTSNASEVGIPCRILALNPKNAPLAQKNAL